MNKIIQSKNSQNVRRGCFRSIDANGNGRSEETLMAFRLITSFTVWSLPYEKSQECTHMGIVGEGSWYVPAATTLVHLNGELVGSKGRLETYW